MFRGSSQYTRSSFTNSKLVESLLRLASHGRYCHWTESNLAVLGRGCASGNTDAKSGCDCCRTRRGEKMGFSSLQKLNLVFSDLLPQERDVDDGESAVVLDEVQKTTTT